MEEWKQKMSFALNSEEMQGLKQNIIANTKIPDSDMLSRIKNPASLPPVTKEEIVYCYLMSKYGDWPPIGGWDSVNKTYKSYKGKEESYENSYHGLIALAAKLDMLQNPGKTLHFSVNGKGKSGWH